MLTKTNTLVWDLMDTKGGIKILEMQTAARSKFRGWNRLLSPPASIESSDKQGIYKTILDYRGITNWPALDLDTSLFLKALSENKTLCSTFMGAAVPKLFPKQKTYSYFSDKNKLQEQVREDFKHSGSIFVKPSIGIKAKGIYVANQDDLIFDKICIANRMPIITSLSSLTNNEIKHFSIQETSIPHMIEKSKGKYVLPTIRIVASVTTGEDNSINWEFHGAYYKHPNKYFLNDKPIKTSIFSENTKDFIISDVINSGSSLLNHNRYSYICNQLKNSLSPFFSTISRYTEAPFIKKALASDNIADFVSVALYLQHSKNTSTYLHQHPDISNGIQEAIERFPEHKKTIKLLIPSMKY